MARGRGRSGRCPQGPISLTLKENPKSLEAKLGLARLDQLAGLTAEAEAGFQKALKSRPDDPLALNALGQFYASQKNWNKALPLLEKAAEADSHRD